MKILVVGGGGREHAILQKLRENPEVETIFLTTSLQYSYLSSTIVKEFASYGGDLSKFVPARFIDRIYDKYQIKK